MNKKLMAAIIAVVLLVTAVGIGVHLLREDALAVTNYIVEITDDGNPFEDLDDGDGISILWKLNGNDVGDDMMTEIAPGIYCCGTNLGVSEFDFWHVEILDNLIDPQDPVLNPVIQPNTVSNFGWDVEDEHP